VTWAHTGAARASRAEAATMTNTSRRIMDE
jgi:hypothetical protein